MQRWDRNDRKVYNMVEDRVDEREQTSQVVKLTCMRHKLTSRFSAFLYDHRQSGKQHANLWCFDAHLVRIYCGLALMPLDVAVAPSFQWMYDLRACSMAKAVV